MAIYSNGLMVIRAWLERGSGKPLRAHIRATKDVSKGFETEVTVADVPAASKEVETWLKEVVADGEASPEGDRKTTKTA